MYNERNGASHVCLHSDGVSRILELAMVKVYRFLSWGIYGFKKCNWDTDGLVLTEAISLLHFVA
jgi:hypothetical protein